MSIHKYARKGGSGYRAVVQLGNGKSTSKKFQRKVDAESWEREQRLVRRAGGNRSLEMTITVADLAERWLSGPCVDRRETSSNHRYEICVRRQIVPYLGKYRVANLSKGVAEEWLRWLRVEQELAIKTSNLCLFILRKILSDAVQGELIRHSPLVGVRPLPQEEREFKFWSIEECAQFLDYVRRFSPEEHGVFSAALYTGMRMGEIQALQWDCVDLAHRQITVKRTFCIREMAVKEKTKSKRVRRIPINPPLMDVLIARRSNPGEFVFPTFDYLHASRRCGALAKAAGVKVIRAHDTRHTFASLYVMSGGEIYKLKGLLGHSTIQMTEKYSHLSPEHLADATNILNFELPAVANVIPLSRG